MKMGNFHLFLDERIHFRNHIEFKKQVHVIEISIKVVNKEAL